MILLVVPYRRETLFTLRECHRLRLFENSVPRNMFDQIGINWQEVAEKCITRSVLTSSTPQILLYWSDEGEWNWQVMKYAWELKRGNCTLFHWGNLKEGWRPKYRWWDNVKMYYRERRRVMWTGFVFLTRGVSIGLLRNMAMNLRVPLYVWNFLRGFSMELRSIGL
jgi:hypothetical protein